MMVQFQMADGRHLEFDDFLRDNNCKSCLSLINDSLKCTVVTALMAQSDTSNFPR